MAKHTGYHFRHKLKRRLSSDEEFQIMKLVLDKFLWLATGLGGYGLFLGIKGDINQGMWFMITGGIIMILFAWIILKEFEQIR